jgi:putative aminopeptidase FrvX
MFAQTPVETVDAKDVDALAAWIASELGMPPLGPSADAANADFSSAAGGDASSPASTGGARVKGADATTMMNVLAALIETNGVSGHEAAVRDQIVKRLPAWAKPHVDDKGNLSVTFGSGGKPVVFVAHMDEVGFEITSINTDGTASIRSRGGMYLSLFEAHPVLIETAKGPVAAVIAPRPGYARAATAQPSNDELFVYLGTDTREHTQALGVAAGQSLTIRKQFMRLGSHRGTGRAMDDRVGSAALLLALAQIDPATISNQVTFAWSVEEETGLSGAAHMAARMKVDTAFAIDTFVSTDTAVDIQRLAGAKLGHGAVLRVLDSRTIVRPEVVDRMLAIARNEKIPLQLGTTSGGTDASAFSAGGAIDIGLSWPGRYSHSPVEVMDVRDLDALVRLIVAVARDY